MTRWIQRARALALRSRALLADIAQADDANVTLITALAIIPALFGLGFTIDYARAEMLQSRINAVADAAALAATDTTYISKTSTVAQAASTQIFTTQVTDYADFVYTPASDLTVTITDGGTLNLGRTALVKWRGSSTNLFSGILGMASLPIGGSSTAYASFFPNINFYLVMDKSPSMLLPSTSSGISAIQKVTGCAFACHQQLPGKNYVKDSNSNAVLIDANYYSSSSSGYNSYYLLSTSANSSGSYNLYNSSGVKIGTVSSSKIPSGSSSPASLSYKDNNNNSQTLSVLYADGYWLTHNYAKVYSDLSSIPLRVGAETLAAQDLIPFAQQKETDNKVTYQLQLYSFDWTHSGSSSPVTQYTNMTDVKSLTTASVPDLDGTQDFWYSNNNPTSSKNINDMGTEFLNMMTSMNTAMPNPGNGSTGNPQEVLMIITDGVVDETISGSRRTRELSSTDIAACTTIKNRKIKIAILYTEYAAATLTGDSWSQTNTAPYLPNVLPALKSCASVGSDGNPLVYTVSSDQSISTALQALFALTLQDSHLVS